MRRIALATLTATALFTLSGCGLPTIIDAVKGKDEKPVATSSAAPTTSSTPKSTTAKPSSTKSTSAKPTSTKSSSTSKPRNTAEVEIPEDQQKIIMDALEPLILGHVSDPKTDTMSGIIRFNTDMKPISFTEFKVNGKPVTVDAAAKKDAEKVFEQLQGTPRDKRFKELEFSYANNRIEATALYRAS